MSSFYTSASQDGHNSREDKTMLDIIARLLISASIFAASSYIPARSYIDVRSGAPASTVEVTIEVGTSKLKF